MGSGLFPCCCLPPNGERGSHETLTEEERRKRRDLQAKAAEKRQDATGVKRDKKRAKKRSSGIDESKVGMNKADWN